MSESQSKSQPKSDLHLRVAPVSPDPLPNPHEAAIQEILRRVEDQVRRELRIGGQTLDQIEEQSQTIGEQIKQIIQEESLLSENTGYQGVHLPCPQGHQGRYVGQRTRYLITCSGSLPLTRAYYHCRECGRGWCPTDQALGLGKGQCSRRVQALIARFCCYLPYRTAAQEMELICGVRLSTGTVERYARRVGERIGTQWQDWQQKCEAQKMPASTVQFSHTERPRRLHGTMDGVMLFVDGAWHEAKLGCFYQTDAEGRATQARYAATLDSSRLFGRRVRVLAHVSGADRCADIAIVADGAEWIWQETGKYFPRSVQVVDYYHVTEHLWEYARARFGEGSAWAKEWVKAQGDLLMADRTGAVIDSVGEWHPRKPQNKQVRDRLVNYLTAHRERLRYGTFRRQGYHIGSGVVESGCKNVVQKRLKGAGMRWKSAGAEAALQRCSYWSSAGNPGFHQFTAH